MRINSKRWRKWKRRQRLLKVRIAKRRIARILLKMPKISDWDAERHNRLVKFVNYLVAFPSEEGVAEIDGAAECPECGNEVWLMADPDGWIERPQPAWRRRRSNRKSAFKVESYGPGIADCCKGFIASQPDGECDFYPGQDDHE